MSTAATKRRIGVVSTVVVALVASLLVWLATRSDGEIVRKADLNDGGVWVTNAEQARYGRINKPAGQLDAGVLSDGSTGSGLDVFQDGAAIVGYSRASNQIVPINPAEGTLAAEQSIVAAEAEHGHRQPRLHRPPRRRARRARIAMIDPAKGEVRAQRVDDRGGHRPGSTASRPRPSRSPRWAATPPSPSVSTARCMPCPPSWATSPCSGPRATRSPCRSTTKLGFTSKSAQVTAVGSHWVVWDSATGKLYSDVAPRAPAAVGRQRRARQPGLRRAPAAGARRDVGAHPGRGAS